LEDAHAMAEYLHVPVPFERLGWTRYRRWRGHIGGASQGNRGAPYVATVAPGDNGDPVRGAGGGRHFTQAPLPGEGDRAAFLSTSVQCPAVSECIALGSYLRHGTERPQEQGLIETLGQP
jgi:hypothetical protein